MGINFTWPFWQNFTVLVGKVTVNLRFKLAEIHYYSIVIINTVTLESSPHGQ